jgi:RimJ/RimL family protein N-acetyltransferase
MRDHTAMESIETKRLILRQWQESDFASFAGYYADAGNAKYVGGQKDSEQAWRHFALQIGHWKLKGFGYWAVDEKETNNFVGCAGLWKSPGWPELELGYWLLKEQQGKGYAQEACRRCKEYALEILSASSLVSYIDPTNAASIRLATRLGAAYEGTVELASYGTHCVYRYF